MADTDLQFRELARIAQDNAIRYFRTAEEYGYYFVIEVKKIRDSGWYKHLGFSSFDDYCENSWNVCRDMMDQRIQIAEAFGNERNYADASRQLGHKKSLFLARLDVGTRERVMNDGVVVETGETKSVQDATSRELESALKALTKAERERDEWMSAAESQQQRAVQFREENERLKREKNPEPVEVVPESIKRKLDDDASVIKHLKADYDAVKSELESLKLQQVDDFNPEVAERKRQRLRLEADISTLQLKVFVDEFLSKTSKIAFMEGALASAEPSVKRKLFEAVSSVEKFIATTKQALNSKIIVEDAQYQEV